MFAAYLWKEWKEYRWLVLVHVALIVLVIAAGWLFLHPQGWWLEKNPIGMLCPILAALLLGVIVFIPDLVPKENRKSGFDLIRRLPGGMSNAYLAKALILAGVLLLYGLAGATSFFFTGIKFEAEHAQYSVSVVEMLAVSGILFLLIFTLSFWGLAISSWLGRGTVVVPATVFAIVGWWFYYLRQWSPTWLVHNFKAYFFNAFYHGQWNSDITPYPSDPELIFLLFLFLPMTAIFASWISFTARKRGDRILRPVLLGAPVLAFSIFAVWGWESSRKDAWYSKIDEEDFALHDILIGEGGRYAFATTSGRRQHSAMTIDLETGECAQEPNASFWGLSEYKPGEYGLAYFDTIRSNSTRCRNNYVALMKEPNGRRCIEIVDTQSIKTIDDPASMKIEGFTKEKMGKLRTLNYYGIRYGTWHEMFEKREELSMVASEIFLFDDLWLVAMKHDASKSVENQPSAYAHNWKLYDAQARTFSPVPCSKGGLCSVSSNSSTFVFYVKSDASGGHVTKMIPGRNGWLVEKEQDGVNMVFRWDAETNSYSSKPVLEDASIYECIRGGSSDWIPAYRSLQSDRNEHFLVNRKTLEVRPGPGKFIRTLTQTPSGRLILLCRENENKADRSLVLFDPAIGKIITEIDHPLLAKCTHFPENAAPNENTVYCNSVHFLHDRRNPGMGPLVKFDFNEKTAAEVRLVEKGEL